jgi:hypothetical protein
MARTVLVLAASAALALSGVASAGALPTPDLRFFAPTLTHVGINGMNGDLKVGSAPVVGADVVVQVGAAVGGPFTDVAHTATNAQGAYTFHVSVPATGWYRTTFAGNAATGPAVSRVLEVVVGQLPTSNSFHAPVAHAPGRTGMNGYVSGGYAEAGDQVALDTGPSSTGPWTQIATTTVVRYGDYTLYPNVSATAWFRTRYLGSASSAPSVSVARLVTVIPGLLLFVAFNGGGNQGGGLVTSNVPVRFSVSVVCGGTIFGGTRTRVFDTINRLVPISLLLVPNSHLRATALVSPPGPMNIYVQSYCPGQLTVRTAA